MAKGSVRKKGKKWYCRFYVENESGNLVQKEYAGTESKSETEAMLRKAMEDYEELDLVCIRSDGAYAGPSAVGQTMQNARKRIPGLEDFHFHTLRHTYTSNLLSGGAKPTDVQELLGHSDVSTTMNIYAHSTREAKRSSARLLDKVVGGD